MLQNPGFNYATIRALLPYIGSTSEMPNESKIVTKINFNQK